MILADTSIWVDHFQRGDGVLVELLGRGQVLTHPFVIGELALGTARQRDRILADLRALPVATVARDDEVLRLIEQETLSGVGIGYVDAHLLAAARLTRDASLWTRDGRLRLAAARLSVDANLDD